MNNFGSTRVPDTTYQVSKPSLNLCPRRRFLPYMGMATIVVTVYLVLFPQPRDALHEIWLQLARWLLRGGGGGDSLR